MFAKLLENVRPSDMILVHNVVDKLLKENDPEVCEALKILDIASAEDNLFKEVQDLEKELNEVEKDLEYADMEIQEYIEEVSALEEIIASLEQDIADN